MNERNLKDVLEERGYQTMPAFERMGRMHVLESRKPVFTGTAKEVWNWLEATGQYIQNEAAP